MRVKIVKDYKRYKAGDTIEVTPNIAFGLIDRSVAVISKDMAVSDYSVKKPVRKAKNG